MKTLRYIPLTFLAGVHGFPMFVSYLAIIAAMMAVAKRFR